jgi:hypothetical protein
MGEQWVPDHLAPSGPTPSSLRHDSQCERYGVSIYTSVLDYGPPIRSLDVCCLVFVIVRCVRQSIRPSYRARGRLKVRMFVTSLFFQHSFPLSPAIYPTVPHEMTPKVALDVVTVRIMDRYYSAWCPWRRFVRFEFRYK